MARQRRGGRSDPPHGAFALGRPVIQRRGAGAPGSAALSAGSGGGHVHDRVEGILRAGGIVAVGLGQVAEAALAAHDGDGRVGQAPGRASCGTSSSPATTISATGPWSAPRCATPSTTATAGPSNPTRRPPNNPVPTSRPLRRPRHRHSYVTTAPSPTHTVALNLPCTSIDDHVLSLVDARVSTLGASRATRHRDQPSRARNQSFLLSKASSPAKGRWVASSEVGAGSWPTPRT